MKPSELHRTAATVLRVLLGLFFCVSSVLKLVSVDDFELYIFSFGFAAFDLSSLAARLIIIGEFILGLGLISGWWHKFVNSVAAVLLVGFSAFLLWRMAVGDEGSCHCLGSLVDMNPWQSLIKNAVALLMLVGAWSCPSELFSEFASEAVLPEKVSKDSIFRRCVRGVYRHKVLTASILSFVTALTIFIINPPDLWFRLTRGVEDDLNVTEFQSYADSTGVSTGRKIVCFYSVDCAHCRHCAEKMAGIIRRHNIPVDSVHCFFMQEYVEMDKAAEMFFDKFGAGLHLPYSSIDAMKFIPLTDGSMPLVCLFEDGVLVKEYDRLTIDEMMISDFIIGQ